jgi:hypothetical protein
MDIRNFLHQKKENKKRQAIFFLILWTIFFVISLFIYLIYQNQGKTRYKVWDTISITGIVHIDNNFPINTHKIKNEKTSFGIKSSSINLNSLLNNKIIINWKIQNISNKIPVLSIDNIKDPESKLIIKENKYFFINELISFDFSKDIDIKAEKEWKNIVIYYQNEPLVQIETFICSKITPTQDCEIMTYNYTKNLNEMFTTFLWYNFYKNNEDSRVTFNENTIWYIFKTADSNFLLNISHLINIINSKFIIENKKDLILDNCKAEDWAWYENINKLSKEIVDDDLIKIDIEWTTINWTDLECKLTIDIRNNREVKNNNTK